MVSRLERGLGDSASLQTWALAAAAVGQQLVSFLEDVPGAHAPRDLEHLRRQELVIAAARSGGWVARPEAPLLVGGGRPRSIDVLLDREMRRELAIVEVWDFLDDVGAGLRSLDEKRLALEERAAERHVGALWVVRGTRRNRALIGSLPELFTSRFPASSHDWLRALGDSAAPMPADTGLVWTDVAGTRLVAWHRAGGRR